MSNVRFKHLGDETRVNVKTFGAVGDGVHDDTAAIFAAIEYALGIDEGTLLTDVGDPYPYFSNVGKKPIFFPLGDYRVTQRIPIRRVGAVFIGEFMPNYAGGQIHQSTIIADHDDHVIFLDADYNPANFGLSHLQIIKGAGHQGQGDGVHMEGANYVGQLDFTYAFIRLCYNGVSLTHDGGFDIPWIKFRDCNFGVNYNYGIYSPRNLDIGGIYNCAITQCVKGGIYIGARAFEVVANDFEGQDAPLTMIGTNGAAVLVARNYFEQTGTSPWTKASIVLSDMSDFTIEHSFTSNHPAGLPIVFLDGCRNGLVNDGNGQGTMMQKCGNIVTDSSDIAIGTAGFWAPGNYPDEGTHDSPSQFSLAWTPSKQRSYNVAAATPPDYFINDSHIGYSTGWNTGDDDGMETYFGDKVIRTSTVSYPENASSRAQTSTQLSIAPGETLWTAFAVAYTEDMPGAAGVSFQHLDASPIEVVRNGPTEIFGISDPAHNRLFVLFGARNDTVNTWENVFSYMYPYGLSDNDRQGAQVSAVISWKTATPYTVIPNIISLLTRERDLIVTWPAGTIVAGEGATVSTITNYATQGDFAMATFDIDLPYGMIAVPNLTSSGVDLTMVNLSGEDRVIPSGNARIKIMKR